MNIRRGLFAFALAVLAAAAAAPRPATAQSRADSAAVLLAAADHFRETGSSEAAESLYEYIADRFAGMSAALSAQSVLDEIRGRRTRAGGETELVVWSTLYGLWLGVAVPGATGASGPEPYGVGLLAGGPAGFLSGRQLTRSRPFSLGQARAVTWGGTWGTFQGLGWANVLDWGEPGPDDDVHVAVVPEPRFRAMIAGGLLGAAGGLLAARSDISPGTATGATAGSLWGSWFGFAAAFLGDADENATWAAVLATGNAGLVAGALTASRLSLTRSRVRMISLSGVIGGFGGLGAVLIVQPDNEDVVIGIPLGASIAGLVAGAILTDDSGVEADPSENAAMLFNPSGSLVERQGGEWRVSTPVPSPAWDLPPRRAGASAAPAGRLHSATAWRIPLVHLRF